MNRTNSTAATAIVEHHRHGFAFRHLQATAATAVRTARSSTGATQRKARRDRPVLPVLAGVYVDAHLCDGHNHSSGVELVIGRIVSKHAR